MNKIDKLIINSPYSEPERYWSYLRANEDLIEAHKETILVPFAHWKYQID